VLFSAGKQSPAAGCCFTASDGLGSGGLLFTSLFFIVILNLFECDAIFLPVDTLPLYFFK
jgi:hypothetical protein